MQVKPSFSTFIPACNSESQLKQNLLAVFAASELVDAQIIVFDDRSLFDTTASYLKSLGSRITLLKNKSNLGFAATVNAGVSVATGDIVILLNTDVRPSADCFTHLAESFRDADLFAVTFNADSTWARGVWRGDCSIILGKSQKVPIN